MRVWHGTLLMNPASLCPWEQEMCDQTRSCVTRSRLAMFPVKRTWTRWWFQTFFIFIPTWGFMIQFDVRIFFRWVAKNHQPAGVILLCPTNLCQEATNLGNPKRDPLPWLIGPAAQVVNQNGWCCVMTVAQKKIFALKI